MLFDGWKILETIHTIYSIETSVPARLFLLTLLLINLFPPPSPQTVPLSSSLHLHHFSPTSITTARRQCLFISLDTAPKMYHRVWLENASNFSESANFPPFNATAIVRCDIL